MRKKIFKLILSFASFLMVCCSPPKEVPREISWEEKKKLVEYLKSHWKTPEDYVVEKFSQYDIVFIGEYHRIKHDLELIHNLIPRLYKAGVYNLGIEFGNYELQDKVDSLITGKEYNEDLARWLMFKFATFWQYKEYIEIYKKAWELNRSLPEGAPKFRVVNLGYRENWNLFKGKWTPEIQKKVFYNGDRDEYMAKVIFKEFVEKGEKALIYSGLNHSFTHYYQPLYNFKKKEFKGFVKTRMGNLIYAKIPDRVFNIILHHPWYTKKGGFFPRETYPVEGVIDSVMKEFKDKRVGFDVKGSPFGELRDDNSYYSVGYDDFTLETICDGYIFQKHLKDYEGCTVDENFITKENIDEAIEFLPNYKIRKFFKIFKSPKLFNYFAKRDADVKSRFRKFE